MFTKPSRITSPMNSVYSAINRKGKINMKIPPKNYDNKLSRRKQDLDQIAKNESDIAALQELPVLPTPAAGDLGKVVKVGSDGYELASDAGAKLVTATVTSDGQGNLSCDKTYAELTAFLAIGDIVELAYLGQTFVYSGIDLAGIHFALARNDSNGHNVITAWTISSADVITYLIEGMNSELPAYSIADEGKFLGVDAQGHLGFFEQPGGDAGGDITWARELVDEWDFTESLVSKNYNKSFVIDGADISRTSDGIVFGTNSTEQTVYSTDLHELPITDWSKIDIEIEIDALASTQSMRALFSVWSSVKSAYSLGLDFEGLAVGFKWISSTFVTPPENFTNIRSAARKLCLNLESGNLYTHGILITGNFTFGSLFADAMADTDHDRFYLGTNAGWLGNPNGYKFKKLRIYKHITQGV